MTTALWSLTATAKESDHILSVLQKKMFKSLSPPNILETFLHDVVLAPINALLCQFPQNVPYK